MVFRLRRYDGERDDYDHGLLMERQGPDAPPIIGLGDPGVKVLKTSDFTLSPQRFYQDERGVRWPVAWSLTINGETFMINALLDNQAIDLSVRYWEGLVEVISPAGDRLGRGYMELTGY